MGCTSSTTASVKQAPSAQPAVKESKIQSNTLQTHGSTAVTGTQPSRTASDPVTNGNSNTDDNRSSPVAAVAIHPNAPSPDPVKHKVSSSAIENKEPSPAPVESKVSTSAIHPNAPSPDPVKHKVSTSATENKEPSPVPVESKVSTSAIHPNAPSPAPVESNASTLATENKEPSPDPVESKASATNTESAPERPKSRSPKPTAQREGSPRSRRAKTAERRARTAGRAREKKELCAQERRDHMMRGLDRFRGAVRKLQGRRDIMERLKLESLKLRDSEAAATEAVKTSEAIPDSTPGEEDDGVIFSLDLEPEVDEGPIPTIEEYLERLRATAPVPE